MYVIAQAPAAAVLTPTAGAVSPFLVIAGEPGAGSQLNLNAPGTNRLNGQTFTVRASGYLTVPAGTATSAATPIQVVLYAANTAAFSAASGNAIFSLTALAVFTLSSASAISVPWEIEAELTGDSVSKNLIGVGEGYDAAPNAPTVAIATARAALGAVVATNTFNAASEPPVQFAVAVNTAASANLGAVTATLKSFQLEA